MTLCDLSSFYCDKGGGVSRYHRARLDWFAKQTKHRYVLISPGARREVRQAAPSVWTVHVYGLRASRDRARYRMLVDYEGVRAAVERFVPDIVETHDPWFALPMGLWLRYRGPYRGLLTTYCHADPIRTYVRPRLRAWTRSLRAAERFADWSDAQLHRQHAACHAAFVASDTMRQRLADLGVPRVSAAPFGVDADLFRIARHSPPRVKRILYAGRLDEDKEFGLVLDVLPQLLRRLDIRVTIAGGGRHAKTLMAIDHPRFRYIGHVSGDAAMRAVYASHDVLLAPGRYETFGLSALEGAAAGLAVVGPSAGGTGELLDQCRSPLVFTPGSAREFLDRVYAASDGDHRTLVQRGRVVAARYGSWSDAITRHVAMYESMLADAGATEAAPDPCARSGQYECDRTPPVPACQER